MTGKRTMIVTGASRGIGAAVARMAAEAGWAVAINYHSQRAEAEALCGEIESAGGRAMPVAADLAHESDIKTMFAAVDRDLPPLGCLVNNAARTAPARMTLAEMDAAEINSLLAVNVTGAMLAAREAVARMSVGCGGSGGSIVNVSSLAAKHGAPSLYVHYAASKGAIDTFTFGLAREVAAQGVRVNAVRPGLIDTEIHARTGMPGRIANAGPKMPLGRAGSAEEVAAAVVWLASDAASYVTGALLDVAGGA